MTRATEKILITSKNVHSSKTTLSGTPNVLIPLEEDAVVTEVEASVLIALIAINLATLAIVAISHKRSVCSG